LDFLAPNTLPELPTRVELEMQKSQQDTQPTATEPLMKSDNETMMEQQPIQSEIAESEVLDCTDIHFDSE
jgi:hypothetical protein